MALGLPGNRGVRERGRVPVGVGPKQKGRTLAAIQISPWVSGMLVSGRLVDSFPT
jgi:hypothetical protein